MLDEQLFLQYTNRFNLTFFYNGIKVMLNPWSLSARATIVAQKKIDKAISFFEFVAFALVVQTNE